MVRVVLERSRERVKGRGDSLPVFHSGPRLDVNFNLVCHSIPVFVFQICEIKGASGFWEDHSDYLSKFVKGHVGLHGLRAVGEERPEEGAASAVHAFL